MRCSTISIGVISVKGIAYKMKKQFKIYEFDESTYAYKNIVSVKVSKKAEKLAKKSQQLFMEHDAVVDALFRELSKDNPNIDFSDFIGDEFAMFTGQVLN